MKTRPTSFSPYHILEAASPAIFAASPATFIALFPKERAPSHALDAAYPAVSAAPRPNDFASSQRLEVSLTVAGPFEETPEVASEIGLLGYSAFLSPYPRSY